MEFSAITQEWKKPKSNDFDRLNKEVRHIQDLTKVTTLEQRVLSLENELKEKTALMENAKRQVVEDKMVSYAALKGFCNVLFTL